MLSHIQEYTSNKLIIQTLRNSLDMSLFDFEVGKNEKKTTFIKYIHINGTDISLSLIEFDGNEHGKSHDLDRINFPHANQYPVLYSLLRGEVSPADAAAQLGIDRVYGGVVKSHLFQFLDEKGKTIDIHHPLHPFTLLLTQFPEIQINYEENKKESFPTCRVKVIDDVISGTLSRYVFYNAEYTIYPHDVNDTKDYPNLNVLQKKTIETAIQSRLDVIIKKLNSPEWSIKVMDRLLSWNIISFDRWLKMISQYKNIDDITDEILNFFYEPCSQNRSSSCLPDEEKINQRAGFVMYKIDRIHTHHTAEDGHIVLNNGRIIEKSEIIKNNKDNDYIIAREEEGLLGLTGQEDENTPPVTHEVVVAYIKNIISRNIENLKMSLTSKECISNNIKKEILQKYLNHNCDKLRMTCLATENNIQNIVVLTHNGKITTEEYAKKNKLDYFISYDLRKALESYFNDTLNNESDGVFCPITFEMLDQNNQPIMLCPAIGETAGTIMSRPAEARLSINVDPKTRGKYQAVIEAPLISFLVDFLKMDKWIDVKKLKEISINCSQALFYNKETNVINYLKSKLTKEELDFLPINEMIQLDENELSILITNIVTFRANEDDEDDFNQFNSLAPFQTCSFAEGLQWLIRHQDLSIKQFASMESEKQILLATDSGFRLLMERGIKLQKLEKLSTKQLESLFSHIHENEDNNQLYAELVFRNKNTIREMSEQIDNMILQMNTSEARLQPW